MARKKLGSILKIRVDKAEKAAWDKLAQAVKVPLSQWAREACREAAK